MNNNRTVTAAVKFFFQNKTSLEQWKKKFKIIPCHANYEKPEFQQMFQVEIVMMPRKPQFDKFINGKNLSNLFYAHLMSLGKY